MTKNRRSVASLVAGLGVGLMAFGRLSLLMTICSCDSWWMDVGGWWEERSSVGGAMLDSGSWRVFFYLNSLRGNKSVLINIIGSEQQRRCLCVKFTRCRNRYYAQPKPSLLQDKNTPNP